MKKLLFILSIVIYINTYAQYSNIFSFSGMDGKSPYSSLYYDGNFLYGMTIQGGVNDSGIIFKIKPDGTGYVKLLDFLGVSNGSYPGSKIKVGDNC